MTTALDELRRSLLPEAVSLLDRLIRIDSRSDSEGGREGSLQRVVAHEMRQRGVQVRTFQPRDIHGFFQNPLCCGPDRDYGDRPTVIGSLGNPDAPALLVMAHADTVPLFEPEQWSVDPFTATRQGDRIYGLGASDDKWGIAAMLAVMSAMADHPSLAQKRILFATTVDEENGVGNGMLLLHLAGVRAEAAVYLDGQRMEIAAGNLGGSNLYLRPRVPMDADRLNAHCAALVDMARTASRRRERLFDGDHFRDNVMRQSSVMAALRHDAKGPFVVVAFYTLPDEEPLAIREELERQVEQALGNDAASFVRTYRSPWFEPATIPLNTPILRLATDAAAAVLGHRPCVTTMSKNDAFVLINHAQIPTIAFGPTGRVTGRGAYHQPDEFLTLDELWAGCHFAHEVVRRWLET